MKRNYLGTVLLGLTLFAVGLYLAYQLTPTLGRVFAQQPQFQSTPVDAPQATETQPAVVADWPIPHTTAARQLLFHVQVMEIDAEKLRDRDYYLAKELGVEGRPQPSPDVSSPIVAALSAREFRLLSSGLILAEAVKVLSEPSIVTTSGRTAKIHSGGEVPVVAVERIVNGKRTKSIDTRAFGTICEITPHFVSDDTLRVEAKIEISTLKTSKEGLPSIIARMMQVTGQVKLGQVLIVAESDELAFRGAGQGFRTTELPAPPEPGATPERKEKLVLVAITPQGVDEFSPQDKPAAKAPSNPPAGAVYSSAPSSFSAPMDENTHPPVFDASPTAVAAPVKLLRDYELVVSKDDLVANVDALTPKAGQRLAIDLYGRNRDEDAKAGSGAFESLHSVLKHVAVRDTVVQRDKLVLHLLLSKRDADRLDLAQRHCDIIPMPSGASSDPGMAPPAPAGKATPLAAGGFSSPGEQAKQDSQTSPLAPLRTELQSLRDEVCGLRGDVQRILQLLRNQGDQEATEPEREGSAAWTFPATQPVFKDEGSVLEGASTPQALVVPDGGKVLVDGLKGVSEKVEESAATPEDTTSP